MTMLHTLSAARTNQTERCWHRPGAEKTGQTHMPCALTPTSNIAYRPDLASTSRLHGIFPGIFALCHKPNGGRARLLAAPLTQALLACDSTTHVSRCWAIEEVRAKVPWTAPEPAFESSAGRRDIMSGYDKRPAQRACISARCLNSVCVLCHPAPASCADS